MICAHMDEVGFMVRSISAKGRSMCCRLAMYAWLPASFQSVRITTREECKNLRPAWTATGRGMTSAPCAWALARSCDEVMQAEFVQAIAVTFDTTSGSPSPAGDG